VKERASYFVGISLANRLLDQGLLVDLDWLFRGFSETFAGQKPALSQEEMVAAIRAFEEEVTTQLAERDRVLAEQNKQREAEFLAQNRNQPGVVVLPSGLQYAILKAGDGPKPKPTDVVRVHYRGVLLDGTEFDTSLDSATPAEFPVNQVIDGWTEALQLMPTGSQWRLFVPAALAYKDQRNGRVIGPNATLVFDVELLAIVGSVGGAVQP
jgi:FKBP-type peptidyl-prolyl cis-trans isomerase FklB